MHVSVCVCVLQISHFYFLFDGLCAHTTPPPTPPFPPILFGYSLFFLSVLLSLMVCVSVKYDIVLEISVTMYQGHQSCRDVAWR